MGMRGGVEKYGKTVGCQSDWVFLLDRKYPIIRLDSSSAS
jgi:hypothetical protein